VSSGIPHCLDSRLIDGGYVVSPPHRSRFNPRRIFSYSFLLEAEVRNWNTQCPYRDLNPLLMCCIARMVSRGRAQHTFHCMEGRMNEARRILQPAVLLCVDNACRLGDVRRSHLGFLCSLHFACSRPLVARAVLSVPTRVWIVKRTNWNKSRDTQRHRPLITWLWQALHGLQNSGIQPFCSRTRRCRFCWALYSPNCCCMIQVIYSLQYKPLCTSNK
jgi:hypothetical protein